jgi:branched-chain amino acid transport system substrate-binding protein
MHAPKLVETLPQSAKIWLSAAQTLPDPETALRNLANDLVGQYAALRAAAPAAVPLSQNTFAGFVSAKIVVEATRRAGKPATSAEILRALTRTGNYDLGGLSFDFSRNASTPATQTTLGVIDARGIVLN